ncbi:MAG: ECF transporter S component [Clostridiales bacterium]|jgi:uncharacterized membrane protein|nr:ECF transporter S component [Clostridiales bacterium]
METNRNTAVAYGVRQITIAGVLTAMTVVTTMFTKIPTPLIQGYFNLGDTVVLLAAVLFGGWTGAFAGAVGSALADILLGGYLFAPITFLVKGIEGFVVGRCVGGGLAGGKFGFGSGAGGSANAGSGAGFGIGTRLGAGPDTRRDAAGTSPVGWKLTLFLCLGAALMVFGYFLAEATVLALFDEAFGFVAAVGELPFNLVQGGLSVALARLILEGLKRARVI